MYYYAVLNTKDIVEYISEQENEVTYYEYISISTSDQSLVGKWYDREGVYGTVGAFLEVPISIQAEHSSSQINYKGQDVWLDEKLDSYATQSDLSTGLAGKANLNHFHNTATQTSDGYMSSGDKAKLDGIEANANLYVHPDTHAASMITGLASVSTTGSYNDLTDKPTIPTIPTALPADGGNADTLDGYHAAYFASGQHNHDAVYAPANHTHDYAASSHNHSTATTSEAGFMSAEDKAKLNGIASGANNYTHPASHPASMITETDSLKVMTAAERTKLSGIAENANNYTHPETHSAAIIEETSLKKVMTAEERTKLAGIESGANKYSHPSTHPATMITGLPTTLPANGGNADTVDGKHAVDFATASHNHDSDYSDINHNHNSEYAGINHNHDDLYATIGHHHDNDYSDISHTHSNATTTAPGFMSKDDKSKLDGIATGANKTTVDSALSSTSTNPVQNKVVNTALAGKAASSHTHNTFLSTTSASTYKLIYVATNGSDSNTGLSESEPMATIKGVIRKYSDKYKMIDIKLADGTYTENIGTIAVDQCSLAIRSASSDKDAVTINMTSSIEFSVNEARVYNLTLNVTETGVRPVCVNAGNLYAYNVRMNVPTNSASSCVNVYNGSTAFLMNCVLNSGTTSNAGAAVYGNQALLIKAINCTSERTITTGFNAYNGTDIEYTATITATNMTKQSSYGKCTVRT